MRIVDRKTFLSLPPGTVYAKVARSFGAVAAGTQGDLCIKGETSRCGQDWWCQSLIPWPESATDTDSYLTAWDNMHRGGREKADYDVEARDSLFDSDQMFLVWDHEDAQALIDRLDRALKQSRG